jgi:hypothetical protein
LRRRFDQVRNGNAIADVSLPVRSEGVRTGRSLFAMFPTEKVPDPPDPPGIEPAVIDQIQPQILRLPAEASASITTAYRISYRGSERNYNGYGDPMELTKQIVYPE